MGRLFGAVVLLLSLVSTSALADVTLNGPGLLPGAPVRVDANPPGGPSTVIYTIENTGQQPMTVVPSITCPPETVEVFTFALSLTVPAQATRQVPVRLVDTEGGAGAGDLVECAFDADPIHESLFVQLVEPAPPSLGRLALESAWTLPDDDTPPSERSPLLADLLTNLQLNVGISGLTAGLDLGYGLTGPEFAIANFDATVGVLNLMNETVFATPFDFRGRALTNEKLVFVKNRFRLRMNLLGTRIENLALFENVKFTDPFFDEAEARDAVQSPSFRFGNVVRIDGSTSMGVPLRLSVGLCADPQGPNLIKERFFIGRACDAERLTFTTLELRAGPVPTGPIRTTASLRFRPGEPLGGDLSLRGALTESVRASARVAVEPDRLAPSRTILTLAQPSTNANLTVILGQDFGLSSWSARRRFEMGEVRASAAVRGDADGLSSFSTTLTLPMEQTRLIARVRFRRPFDGEAVRFQQVSANLTQSLGPLEMNASMVHDRTELVRLNLRSTLRF